MSTLLEDVPDNWGQKIEVESGAVMLVRTRPSEISFNASANMAAILLTPQSHHNRLAPAGSLEIIPSGTEYSGRQKTASERLLIAFDDRCLAKLAALEFGEDAFEFEPLQASVVDKRALQFASLFREEFRSRDTTNTPCIDALITLFGAHMLRTYASSVKQRDQLFKGGLTLRKWLLVDDYIRAHLSERLSIERLSRVVDLSPSHFIRAFHQTAGQSPHQYIIAQRLASAEQLIVTTDMPLTRVARIAGFSSNSHMTATMKRHHGTTPRGLRRENRSAL